MIDLLKQQYDMICSAREVELSFLKGFSDSQLITPVSAFNNKTLIYFAVHINQVYIHWIGKFALELDMPYIDEESVKTIAQVGKLFEQTNLLLERFFEKFAGHLDQEIDKDFSGKKIKTSALQLFTHVITHEFH
ncbi:MAG: hypothetical protein EOO44_22640, partial [Flavobacterium sp.]